MTLNLQDCGIQNMIVILLSVYNFVIRMMGTGGDVSNECTKKQFTNVVHF